MGDLNNYFNILLVIVSTFFHVQREAQAVENQDFEVILQWQFLNYTWSTSASYNLALKSSQYIPENNAPTGIKIYMDKIYLSVPRVRPGVPATLTYVPMVEEGTESNQLLTPYPSWEMNTRGDCAALQSVESMEIDKQGHMWVIDGVRINDQTECPPKLVILDLKTQGRVVHTYIFPEEIAMRKGGFLTDLVVDESGGGFAYITDSSNVDPGLVVYSRKKNKSWKLRDPSFFAELNAGFVVEGTPFKKLVPINGIALSPPIFNKEKKLFYCALTALSLYSINTNVLKNESFVTTDQWHKKVELVGRKQGQSDGLMMDNAGNLYCTLLPTNGIGRWNVKKPFNTSEIIFRSDKMIWPATFALDQKGFLYVLSNRIYEFIDSTEKLYVTSEYKFRVFRDYTGTKSYMY